MQKLLFVGIGGFFGSCLRYIISIAAPKICGETLPYGTLVANVLGGILIGFIIKLSSNTQLVPQNLKLFVATGMMGSLTTFSTFSYETINLFYESKYTLGTLNIFLNLILSLLGVILGRYFASLM